MRQPSADAFPFRSPSLVWASSLTTPKTWPTSISTCSDATALNDFLLAENIQVGELRGLKIVVRREPVGATRLPRVHRRTSAWLILFDLILTWLYFCLSA